MRRILLLSLALPTMLTGAWALLAPASWHGDFPGFDRDWLPFFGAYNEHLARDYGGALLALGILLAWAALSPRVRLARAIPAAFLAFALPHFVFHVANAGELPAGDEVVNLVTLVLSVLIPVALLLIPPEGAASMRAPASGPDGWRLPPARPRGVVDRITYAITRRRFGHVLGPIQMAAHNPPILKGYTLYELLLERADGIDPRLENLAAHRAATMTGCPFCIDFGEGHLPDLGLSAQQVRDVLKWRESDAYSDDERLVLEYAEQISDTPVAVDDELFDRLRERFDEAAIVELTAAIAFENYRGRFNHALGLGSEGFCDRSQGSSQMGLASASTALPR
ncbi:MAG TPA: carboxymuconolactone decarboxylase family protein [Thermoleophilaceae bacterium]|nr:carboxymuconolactone decarboxylase family protein [Thermoleophilaceae bacterium]